MRPKTDLQVSIFDFFSEHTIGRELRAISDFLDANPGFCDRIAQTVIPTDTKPTGRKGFSADQILRFAVLKQFTGYSFRELAFYLEDSETFRTFARCWKKAPSFTTLQSLLRKVDSIAWEANNRFLVLVAKEKGIENGEVTRTDSTVTETHIHEPSDSRLLFDCVRVITRLLQRGKKVFGSTAPWSNHMRATKKLANRIGFESRKKSRKPLYRKMINHTQKMLKSLAEMADQLKNAFSEGPLATWLKAVEDLTEITICVLSQTDRRVFLGEKVPAKEKIYSIFEHHTDLIVKGQRAIQYGHKLNLTTGRSGLVLDLFVEDGNPCDTATTLRMIERQKDLYGQAPRQTSLDGGYASQDNLEGAKALGVQEVAFHKKRNLKVEDMVSSATLYRKLKAFRAGIEANIASLKNNFNLKRCNWKGLEGFKAFAWSGVFAYNLFTLIRAG